MVDHNQTGGSTMSIRRIAAAVMITGTLVVGAAAPAFARHGADDPAGHVRQEHRQGQVEVEHQGHHR
jgi:hypothetical protein